MLAITMMSKKQTSGIAGMPTIPSENLGRWRPYRTPKAPEVDPNEKPEFPNDPTPEPEVPADLPTEVPPKIVN